MLLPQTADERLAQTEDNLRRWRYPRLGAPKPDRAGTVAVVGFGPSLLDTWDGIREADAVCTTSGAHDFLIQCGIVPTYHVEIDPRPHKAFFLRHSRPEVEYLIASTCHRSLFAQLYAKKRKVVMWHGYTDDDKERQFLLIKRHEDPYLLSGGTNAGMRSFVVMRHLGFRRFMFFGIDCSYRGAAQWAGEHSGRRHETFFVECGGRVYETSDVMMTATDDFFNEFLGFPGCAFGVAGDGLLAMRFEIFKRDPKLAVSSRWWKRANKATA